MAFPNILGTVLCHFVPAHLTGTALALLWSGIFCFVQDSVCASASPAARLTRFCVSYIIARRNNKTDQCCINLLHLQQNLKEPRSAKSGGDGVFPWVVG